jgi:RNA polymerase I-associated factor PAF67
LKPLIALGSKSKADAVVSPVSTFFRLFGSAVLSRLECLLGVYTSCLQALDVANAISDRIIVKENDKPTARQVLTSVVAAKVSLAYHAAGIHLPICDCAGTPMPAPCSPTAPVRCAAGL